VTHDDGAQTMPDAEPPTELQLKHCPSVWHIVVVVVRR
jgi:hypothetical protein